MEAVATGAVFRDLLELLGPLQEHVLTRLNLSGHALELLTARRTPMASIFKLLLDDLEALDLKIPPRRVIPGIRLAIFGLFPKGLGAHEDR